MQEYEALVIIDPKKEESVKQVQDSVTSAITKQNGKVLKEENWGKQRLSYAIKKTPEGIYFKLDFSIKASEIAGLKAGYRLNPDILRLMITKK